MPNGKYPCKVRGCTETFDTYQARGRHMKTAHKRHKKQRSKDGRRNRTNSKPETTKSTHTLPVVPRYCWNCGAPHLKSATIEMSR